MSTMHACLQNCPTTHAHTGSFDGVVLVWDVATGQPVHTYKGHAYQAAAVAVLPSGDVASASVDK
jgi:WD40 repeat protein